jgi:hypothetical protein
MALLVTSFVASLSAGSPPANAVPDIALGWTLLLHIERAAAVAGVLGLTGVVLWRAGLGELPFRFANIEYEAHSGDAGRAIEHRVEFLERAIWGLLDEREEHP